MKRIKAGRSSRETPENSSSSLASVKSSGENLTTKIKFFSASSSIDSCVDIYNIFNKIFDFSILKCCQYLGHKTTLQYSSIINCTARILKISIVSLDRAPELNCQIPIISSSDLKFWILIGTA